MKPAHDLTGDVEPGRASNLGSERKRNNKTESGLTSLPLTFGQEDWPCSLVE